MERSMKLKKIIFLSFLLMAVNVFAATTNTAASSSASIDKIVVIVNEDVIMQSEVNQAMAAAKKQLMATNTPLPADSDLRKQVIDNLINLSLERQMINRANITISDSELNDAIENIAKSNNMNLADFKTAVEQSGMSFAQYRKQIREQMQLNRLQQAAAGQNIIVSDQEVEDFMYKYKSVPDQNAVFHIEDILVPVSSAPTPDELQKAKQKAQQIMQQLKKGADFRQIAAAESGGATALQGGDLGWRRLPEMPTIFAEAVRSLHKGDVAGPLQAPNGFHIIKLVDVKGGAQQLTETQVRELIYRRKLEEQVQNWLKQARDAAYIQYVQ
jgi:peptidyl-prolyl cis-trans isomerase SurA